jgi:hypothetical protein
MRKESLTSGDKTVTTYWHGTAGCTVTHVETVQSHSISHGVVA